MSTNNWTPFNNRTETRNLTDAEFGAMVRATKVPGATLWYYVRTDAPLIREKVNPSELHNWEPNRIYYVHSPVEDIQLVLRRYLGEHLPASVIYQVATKMGSDPLFNPTK